MACCKSEREREREIESESAIGNERESVRLSTKKREGARKKLTVRVLCIYVWPEKQEQHGLQMAITHKSSCTCTHPSISVSCLAQMRYDACKHDVTQLI